MKMDDKVRDQIIDFLLLQPCAKKSVNGRELTMRCAICGDSTKSNTSTNFFVNISKSLEGKPMPYQCFRVDCQARGIIDQDFLSMLGFNKYDVLIDLNKYNKVASKGFSNKNFISNKKKLIRNVITTQDKISDLKLNYINKRLGLSLSYEDIFNLKINLNFKELLNFNEVKIAQNNEYKYNLYDMYGVSFISAYNDYAIIRDITKGCKKIGKRYTNVNIFDNYENVNKYYCIPTKLDVLEPTPTVLNVAEGAYDIISVYYNLDIDREYKNQLFVAACGAGIVNVCLHFIRMYGLTNLKINVFGDNDANMKIYNGLYRLAPYLNNFNISIYHNLLEKDFGVSKDKISITKTKLKER